MHIFRLLPLLATLCLVQFAVSGCYSHDLVRHLNSDICLITPQLTAKEVVSYLGVPDKKQTSADGEIWVYYDAQKSTLRKTPFIGNHLGYIDYDVVTIIFRGDQVHTCVYRSFNEDEFKKNGFKIDE
ncbi:MAG: hypothetical protein OEY01_12585 [Desulfobulbaceae bacterium]|nr:hypothetical protein [Desulfobulbaceae bacterium]HIJ79595.1 hypothetical protein [Deltaproteobacteria bacterium]